MPLYENGIIYKLCHCNDLENNNIYVGSTTNFRMRKNHHKNSCNNEKNKKYNKNVYQFIRDNGNWIEWQMIPIEVFPCNDKKELEVRERHHIELLKSKLNKIIPTRTKKEWRNDNKEIIAEKNKQYREANKQIIKEWCEDNKEIILENKKKYYEDNKEKILEYKKQYYEDNKETKNQKVICDHCGAEINKQGLKRHQKTKKCIETV